MSNIWATSFGATIILTEGGFSRGDKKQDLDARLFMIGDPIEEPVVHASINMCKYFIITSICSNTSLIGQASHLIEFVYTGEL